MSPPPHRLFLETDQERCFDAAGLEVPCAGSGQDAEMRHRLRLAGKRFDVPGDTVREHLEVSLLSTPAFVFRP